MRSAKFATSAFAVLAAAGAVWAAEAIRRIELRAVPGAAVCSASEIEMVEKASTSLGADRGVWLFATRAYPQEEDGTLGGEFRRKFRFEAISRFHQQNAYKYFCENARSRIDGQQVIGISNAADILSGFSVDADSAFALSICYSLEQKRIETGNLNDIDQKLRRCRELSLKWQSIYK